MRHPNQTMRQNWFILSQFSLSQVVCPPGHRDRSDLRSVPASPAMFQRKPWHPGKTPTPNKMLAITITTGVWCALAIIAEIIRFTHFSATAI